MREWIGNFWKQSYFPTMLNSASWKWVFFRESYRSNECRFCTLFLFVSCNKISFDCFQVPATPEPENIQEEFDIEDFGENPEEIPMINLNMEAFTENLQNYMENNMELAKGDMSKALVALTSETASIPTPKLKNVSQLRTEHHV